MLPPTSLPLLDVSQRGRRRGGPSRFVSSVSAICAKKTWARCGMDQRRIITRVSKARNSKKTLGERLLPMIYYLLPITYYLLPTTYSTLPTTSYLLPTTYYLLPITYMFSHVPMSNARILNSQSSEVHFSFFLYSSGLLVLVSRISGFKGPLHFHQLQKT